jgi:hypothetical protein
MNTFQECLSSKHFAWQIAASVRTRWENRAGFKGRPSRFSRWRHRSTFMRALPADSPLPAMRGGTCQYFRSDPAWVAGVFSGLPSGTDYVAACAADSAPTEPSAAQWRLQLREFRC